MHVLAQVDPVTATGATVTAVALLGFMIYFLGTLIRRALAMEWSSALNQGLGYLIALFVAWLGARSTLVRDYPINGHTLRALNFADLLFAALVLAGIPTAFYDFLVARDANRTFAVPNPFRKGVVALKSASSEPAAEPPGSVPSRNP